MLEVSKISKSFGGLRAVNGVSFKVKKASVHSLIGPNGAGKTTLFNLITGAFSPESGQVKFDNQDITSWPSQKLAKMGLVRTFQRTSIFKNLTVLENVALSIRSRDDLSQKVIHSDKKEQDILEEARRTLALVGLKGREEVNSGFLAHGLQRALDIAIGLALKPRVIMMDEPLAGMSRGDRETVASLILKLRDELGITIVVVEHDVGMVMRLSDRITVMQMGQVIADATPDEIRNDEAVRKAYLHGSFAS